MSKTIEKPNVEAVVSTALLAKCVPRMHVPQERGDRTLGAYITHPENEMMYLTSDGEWVHSAALDKCWWQNVTQAHHFLADLKAKANNKSTNAEGNGK